MLLTAMIDLYKIIVKIKLIIIDLGIGKLLLLLLLLSLLLLLLLLLLIVILYMIYFPLIICIVSIHSFHHSALLI